MNAAASAIVLCVTVGTPKRARYATTSPVPRPSSQGTPAALPYPILRRLSSPSTRRAALGGLPRRASRRAGRVPSAIPENVFWHDLSTEDRSFVRLNVTSCPKRSPDHALGMGNRRGCEGGPHLRDEKLATSSMAHSHGRCAAASPGSWVPSCCTRVCQRCAGRSSSTGGGTRLISMRRFWARPSGVVFGASGR